jgi:hypothetical protein
MCIQLLDIVSGVPVENSAGNFVSSDLTGIIATDYTFIVPTIHIVALEGHIQIRVLMKRHSMNLKFWRDSLME